MALEIFLTEASFVRGILKQTEVFSHNHVTEKAIFYVLNVIVSVTSKWEACVALRLSRFLLQRELLSLSSGGSQGVMAAASLFSPRLLSSPAHTS